MHNAERTEARLNYSTVSGLTPSSALDSTCRFQRSLLSASCHVPLVPLRPGRAPSRPPFLFLPLRESSGLRGLLRPLIGGIVFPFPALLLLMPPSR